MSKDFEFSIIGSIGEINLIEGDVNCLKIEAYKIVDVEYVLCISFLKTHRIIYCKLSLNKDSFCGKDKESNKNENFTEGLPSFKVSLWRLLHLPFQIWDFSFSNEGFWTMGQEYNLDIKPYVKDVLKLDELNKSLLIDDNAMDIDDGNEFHPQEFEIVVKLPTLQKCTILKEKLYLKCNLTHNGIIICSKDEIEKLWCFDLIISRNQSSLKTELSGTVSLPSIPLTYNKKNSNSEVIHGSCTKPVITFIYDEISAFGEFERSQKDIFHMFLSLDPSFTSNCICLIGHPEGRVLYFLCSWSAHIRLFKTNTQPALLFDLKQPVIGIHFINEMGGIKGNGLLIVGALGKMVFISAEISGDNPVLIQIKCLSLYVMTFNLPSYVEHYTLFRGNIIHLSPEGDVWVSIFSAKKEEKCDGKENLKLLKKSIVMKGVTSFLLLNEFSGLFLFITKTGCLYLSLYVEQKYDMSISLPSLMNEAMYQSSSLQNLSSIKACQGKLFEALSTFACLKLISGTPKVKITYEVLKLHALPKRLCLIATIKSLENCELNPDFWYITASVFNCFQKDHAIVSKTVPFNIDTKAIVMEVEESVLSSTHSSVFPLYLVIGLILTLPERFKSMSCFKLVGREFPLYVPLQIFIVSELSLLTLKSKTAQSQVSPSIYYENTSSFFEDIHAISMQRPIFKYLKNAIMQSDPKSTFSHPLHFNLCLLTSNLDEMIKSFTTDSTFGVTFLQSLLQRTNLENHFVDETLCYENQPITFQVSKQSDTVNITIDTNLFAFSARLKLAFIDLLYKYTCKVPSQESRFIMISACLSTKCEKLSQELLAMCGQEVETTDFLDKIWSKYSELRKISSTLRYC